MYSQITNIRRLSLALSAALLLALTLSGCADATDSGGEASTDEPVVPETKEEAADATNNGKADWGFDVCSRNSWYGDRACDWFCPRTDPDCQLEPLGPDPAGEPTAFPIVLAHGFMGSDTNFWAFNGVADALRADGHRVYEAEVPPFHSVEVRASELANHVDAALADSGADKVNIIAHSMGGLDSRHLIANLDYGGRVASLTTISTPHRGSRIADVYLDLMPEAADVAVDAIAELAGGTFSDVADEADVRAAMESIAEANSEDFDAANPDDSRVFYQSWAGVSSVLGIRVDGFAEACDQKLTMHDGTMDHMSGLLVTAAALVAGFDLTLNDGMVTIASAKWGEFRGCIPADHLDEVGQVGDDGPVDETGFDHIRFYRNLAFDLQILGF